jgi:hypothetical protein
MQLKLKSLLSCQSRKIEVCPSKTELKLLLLPRRRLSKRNLYRKEMFLMKMPES